MKHPANHSCSFRLILDFLPLKEKIKFLLFIIIAINFRNIVQAQSPSIADSASVVHITGTPTDVIKKISFPLLHFSKVKANRINFGMVGEDYKYFIIKAQSAKGDAENMLSIDNTSLDTVSIYKIDIGQKSILTYQGGALVPFKKSSQYVWHTAPLLITEAPSYYLVALKAPGTNINVYYEIIDKDKLQKKYLAHDRIVFFYVGVFCLIAFIIFLAYYLFRQNVFIIYLGYIICISAWIMSHYGYLFPSLYPRVPVINKIVKPLTSLGSCYFLITLLYMVFKQALGLKPWLQSMLRGMRKVLPFLSVCMLLLLVPSLSSAVQAALMMLWHTGLLFSICLIVFTPLYFIRSGPTAKIFSIAMLVVCLMALIQLFANSGYINNYFISEHGVTMGSLIENFIITFGLFYSLLEENNEKKKQVILLEQDKNDTLKKLVTLQDDERKRIANDLHDNIGPLLAAIKINVQRLISNKDGSLNGLGRKTELIIEDSISEIRNVAHNLMPKGLASKGLIIALKDYFENIESVYNKNIIFNHEVQSIPCADIQANIYRIICELVLNAVKHSEATELCIFVGSDNKTITVSIKDNGKGFNLKTADFKSSFGLQSAESRVHYMNGKFNLKTAPGHGTLIDMQIPLQANQS